MNVTEDIKSRLDIVEMVGETVQLRRSGRSYTGFCPFHQNTRTPAFVVFPETQTWRCFGACADGGDLFSYVMKKEGWDFKEALRNLAQRAGVALEELSPAERKQRDQQERLADLLDSAADYFHQLLLYAPQAEHVRRYVEDRALESETVATFRLGFALNSWDACRSHFTAQGYDEDELVAAGLLTENPERNTRYDRFRNRLMIPIRDAGGRIAGFGARTLDPDGIPKYLNSPQTELFDKSRLLFGLDLAKRHIREARQAVIVEGYMDVMQGWQHGFRNIVAQMGTALTGEQLALLKRYTRRFVLALDADAAGAQATMRSLEVARETLDREVDVRFDAPYLVRHEGRLQADIRIVSLPEGQDPDKIIRENPSMWAQLVGSAQPVVTYVIEVTTQGLDLQDAKAKSAVVQRVMPLIQDVADPVERDHYRQLLARKLRVDERALLQVSVSAAESRPRRTSPDGSRAPGAGTKQPPGAVGTPMSAALRGGRISIGKRETAFLGQCMRHFPALLVEVDGRLRDLQQPPVEEKDFSWAEDRALWRLLRLQMDLGTVAAIDEVWDSLDSALRQRMQFLLEVEEATPQGRERLPDLLALAVLDLRLEKIRRQLSDVQQLFFESQSDADPGILALYRQQMQTLPQTIQQLNKARWSLSALNRRKAEIAANHR